MQTSIRPDADNGDQLSKIQKLRKLFLALVAATSVILVLFSDSLWVAKSSVHIALDYLGYLLILACVIGRAWCALYIGGNKKSSLVVIGPYSTTRNPLYLFSVLGSVGIGFQAGNVSTGVLLGLFVFGVFSVVIGQEEKFLLDRFGEDFQNYCEATPRWWPKLSCWKDVPTLLIQVDLVRNTFRDALWFVVAIPLIEAVKLAQGSGMLPTLLFLP